jgi:putative ABC transport system permease protein
MLKNFIKTSFRVLSRNKTHSFLNIFGLAIGIACAGLIFLWVEDELHFDAFNIKKDRLYFARVNSLLNARVFTHGSSPGVLAPAMQAEIPGIANTCRTSENQTRQLFAIGDKSVYAYGIYAEPSLFRMFTLPFVEGNAKTAFSQLHSLVITEKTAKKFFGNEKPVIGKTVRVDNKQDYVISGVVKDIPENSSLNFEWAAPFQIWWQQSPWAYEWGNNCLSTYVELKPGASLDAINKQLYNFVQKRAPTSTGHIFLFGMNNWHLYGDFDNGKPTGSGQIVYVRLFAVIAWIILVIACINFMNLATARSEKRAREVGVRKVMGSGRRKLIFQFIGEALFLAFLSAIFAVVFMTFALPAFSLLVQKNLSLGWGNPVHIIALVLITLICGIVAGSYPALYLSSFNPVFVLKGIRMKAGSAAFIRKGLVVLQFTISIVLIICTVIIFQQIQHIKDRKLGFNKDGLLEMEMQGDMGKHFESIRQDLLHTGSVEHVALADHATIYGGNNTDGLSWQAKPAGAKILVSWRSVGADFFAASGLKVIDGRDFYVTDTLNYDLHSLHANAVITESLAKLMGLGSAIGKTIFDENDTLLHATVVGVVNDYVYGDMYGKPDPVIFFNTAPRFESVMYVKTKAATNPELALKKIEAVMKKNNPGYPFVYQFVDEQFNNMFQTETLMSKLSRVFASLAIIISCLGLFGLAAYTAERRIKEIGIRKVLGATVTGLAGLLSVDFLKLVLLSVLLAFPLAWYAMHNWLQNYQYRTEISWWVFVVAGVAAILIAIITVSFQAIRAAVSNPIQSLRSE